MYIKGRKNTEKELRQQRQYCTGYFFGMREEPDLFCGLFGVNIMRKMKIEVIRFMENRSSYAEKNCRYQ